MTRITVGLLAVTVFTGSFLVTIRQTHAGCNSDCRERWLFIKLGANGLAWGYDKPSCYHCTPPATMCLDTNPALGGTCIDSTLPNLSTDLTGPAAACLVPLNTQFCEATGMPKTVYKACENYWHCDPTNVDQQNSNDT